MSKTEATRRAVEGIVGGFNDHRIDDRGEKTPPSPKAR